MPPPNKEGAFCCITFLVRLCFFGGVLFHKSLVVNDLRGPRRRKPLMFNALRNDFFLNLFKISLDAPPLFCHTYILTVKKDTSTLAQRVEDLTEMLNRVRSVIRAAGVDRTKQLDPKGLLQMSKEEYAAQMDKLQEISDKHDARKKVLAGISADELDQLLTEHHLDEICEALSR